MISLPSIDSAIEAADWIELCSIKAKSARLSKSDILDQFRDYGITGFEDLCEHAWSELQRRAVALGQEYGFSIESSAVVRRAAWKERPFYSMMLLVSASSKFRSTKIKNYNEVAKLFERAVAMAMAGWIGGKAHRVGHGREKPVPSNFSSLLKFLATEMSENLRSATPLNPATKDCRADVVAWRPFCDKRSGQLIVFAQCALGMDWRNKLTDLNIDLWKRYLDFTATPVRAFAMPFTEVDDGIWIECGTHGGIAFDRLRLAEHLPAETIPAKLAAAMNKWTRSTLAKIPED